VPVTKGNCEPWQRDKAIRLLEYLLRLASLRTKLSRDVGEYEKVLWISDVPQERGCFTQAWGRDEEHDPDEWIEVQNRREPELPAVPGHCKEWVNSPSLRNKNDLPELLPEITRQIPNPDWREDSDHPETIPRTERLENHPEVQQAWDRYVEDKWLPWTEDHNAWERVHKVYSALFAIHQEQLRLGEEYELVLGLGLLTWQTPNGQRVRRHLAIADAILEFEARHQRFTVKPHSDGTKLRPELDMLDPTEQPQGAEQRAKEGLVIPDARPDTNPQHEPIALEDPWERSTVEAVLEALAHSFSSIDVNGEPVHGEYFDRLGKQGISARPKPIVECAPALILRKRSAKGLTETLKRIKEQIGSAELIPGEFADLAEIRPKDGREPSDELEEANAEFEGEVFFPRPSNDEQRRIVDKIRATSGVLVQGPPGTGKSHTIANLIAHLLATGQRILVTAKTPRALQVLMGKPGDVEHQENERARGLIDKEIRPLCISLLGSGMDERKSLESSVGGILRKNEEWNENRAKRERTELENHLRKLREEKAKVNRRLRGIRESETHTQSIAEGAYPGTAARIAEAVNRDRSAYGWFTDSVPLDKTCPISVSDLRSVLVALRQLTQEKRRELGLAWPEGLPSPERFANLVRNEASATEEEQNSARGADERFADLLARDNPPVIEAIRNAFSSFQDTARGLFATPHSWMNDALRDILARNSSLWHELLRVTREVIMSIEELVAVADETNIEFPDTTDIRALYDDARILKEHMENGGKLGWGLFRPRLVKERLYVTKSVKVGGRPCSTVEHFSTLAGALHVRIECEKAWGFWKGRSEKDEGPYALQLTALKSLRDALENALALEDLIAKCREATNQCSGMGEPVWADESQVESIVSSCRLALARIRKRLAAEEVQRIEAPISRMAAKASAHSVTNDLLRAIRSRDMDKFSRCASTIQDLDEQRQRLRKVSEYLSKLRCLLPQFTKSLERTCNEPYWEERIQHIGDAWHWGQARYWIEDYIRQEDVPALAKRAKQIEDEINSAIAKLASLHAWSFCFSRLGREHEQHMVAWQQAMHQLGGGHGIHAPHWRREAQKHLNRCREAVPAWVMPLHRVWDTVEPAPGIFDVIIVDEASQCGFDGLPLFYLGKKIIVVGDDKQIRPDAVGVSRFAVQKLQEEFLFDFEFKSSFDVERSIFDHSKRLYQQSRIVLREHFRCMPEIIRFSNDLCYSDTPLIPLRQYGPNRLPPLEHIFVSGGYREGSNNRTINRPEAEAIVEKIAEMCGDSRYDGKTMGVVVLQGEAQAGLIESLLLERLGAGEMERRRLVCGNPYSFQGDERDIMFLSLVAATNARIGPLTKPADERRFNVAASRARDMMVLFHSVTCDDLSTADLRRRLLDFFENPMTSPIGDGIDWVDLEHRAIRDNRSQVKPPPPFHQPGVVIGSWFEVDVTLIIHRKGYRVTPQFPIAEYHIDLVVEGGMARLAVECDGDHCHGADRYEADMQRQRQLERCEWEFFRVRESAFYANRDDALAGLWRALEERDIFPMPHSAEAPSKAVPQKEDCHGVGCSSSENGGDVHGDDDSLHDDSRGNGGVSSRRAEAITAAEIQHAILQALSGCPNMSCTEKSLTSRVLREVGVLTRGTPRLDFEKRVMRSLAVLERRGIVERYRAKNKRVRLCETESNSSQLSLGLKQ
jgi:very-short-patch-repair endonuclease